MGTYEDGPTTSHGGRHEEDQAQLFISLDGVVEAPDRWHFPYFNDEMGAASCSSLNSPQRSPL
ncbi:hypothetical protein [Streptomyces sp. ISL-100]|uniref:hypothetical protein n=1 Tax=Streptomyces sp. ISL-100 TaxID=2819173 RepID=UPI002035410F|nr:hypothetical protein [Streptomyces sp. ISL-100]